MPRKPPESPELSLANFWSQNKLLYSSSFEHDSTPRTFFCFCTADAINYSFISLQGLFGTSCASLIILQLPVLPFLILPR
jgi:hypothetical protein